MPSGSSRPIAGVEPRPPTRKAAPSPRRIKPAWSGWRRRGALGIDIGTTAVKLVELSPLRSGAAQGRRHSLLACGAEPLPPGIVSSKEANIRDPDAVGDAVARLCGRVGAKARAAILAIPHSAAVMKTLRMDATLTNEEMDDEVALQAARLFPFPPEETALDFEPAQLCADDPGLVEVTVVGCRASQVRERQTVAGRAGLSVRVVEVDMMALARAAAPAGDATLGVVELGAHAATLLARDAGGVPRMRQEPFDRYHAAQPPATALVDTIVRLLRLFAASQGGAAAPPARLLLAGGRAATPALADLAAERLELPVAVADPFADMAIAPDFLAAARADSALLATACGLARRGVAGRRRFAAIGALGRRRP